MHDAGIGIGGGLALVVREGAEFEITAQAVLVERHRLTAIAAEHEISGYGFHDLSFPLSDSVGGTRYCLRRGKSSRKRRSRSQRPPHRRAPKITGKMILKKGPLNRTFVATPPPS